jgi:uncharacterized protein YehS (DUF1456 family)
MTNNDCLRRLRYIFDLNDKKMMAIFDGAGYQAKREQISSWLKKDDHPDYKSCSDTMFATFLNGFINEKRGKREGEQPQPENKLTNNIIFMKIKIALNLKSDDILELLDLAGFVVSKHELSAFFRRADHKHYRQCKDQIFRNFLNGLQIKHRNTNDAVDDEADKVIEEVPFKWPKA